MKDRTEFRLSQKIEPKDDPIIINLISIDTDFIAGILIFIRKLEGLNINIQFVMPLKKTKSDAEDPSKIFKTGTVIVLCNAFYEELKTKLASYAKFPEMTFAAAILMSGSDFVDGYYGITPETTLETLLAHPDQIGDLCNMGGNDDYLVDQRTYLRFLKAQYVHKYKKQLVNYIRDATPKKAKTTKKPSKTPTKPPKEKKGFDSRSREIYSVYEKYGENEDLFFKNISWDHLDHIIKAKNPKSIQAWIPSVKTIWLRYSRLCLNIRLLIESSSGSNENIDLKSLRMGYSLIDKEKTLSKSNIRMTLDTDDVTPSSIFVEEIKPSLLM